jgi:hypothetical protein
MKPKPLEEKDCNLGIEVDPTFIKLSKMNLSPVGCSSLTSSWADPSSDINRFPTKPSKLLALLVHQKEMLRTGFTSQSHLR